MANTYTDICIHSYNSRGFDVDKQDVCKLLMLNNNSIIPILCNQEHFQLQGNSYKIKQALPDCRIFFKKAIKDTTDGRPKNGMFIAVPKEIEENVEDVSPHHWRIQAVIISTMNNKILVINSYFPTDPRTQVFDTSDLISTLDTINDMIISNKCDHLIWAGDLNADFVRNTKFTTMVENFIMEKDMYRSWDKYQIDYTHVADINGVTYTSTIDHLVWSAGIHKNIVAANVLHLPQNLSDHCPIYCLVKIDGLSAKPRVILDRPKSKKHLKNKRTIFVVN